ncbi:Sorting nexin, cytoplasm-to-vacuole targeting pathway/endosomal sorting [Stygiomarasmius scandens]|uniref:Sorting nexin, cytoplasm-to-vacuole targeting pathway/endosomal sorting n=1 Tax=Marasmiellus scandens TaxID=2682957 RepID=A0ABR1IZJ6_9AGAR
MVISMAKSHHDWCKKNLEAWEEAKGEIDKIPEHPNNIPSPSPQDSSAPVMGRRDSTATVNGR